jgi:hypothetical protein
MTILPFGGRRQLAVNIGEPIALQRAQGFTASPFMSGSMPGTQSVVAYPSVSAAMLG